MSNWTSVLTDRFQNSYRRPFYGSLLFKDGINNNTEFQASLRKGLHSLQLQQIIKTLEFVTKKAEKNAIIIISSNELSKNTLTLPLTGSMDCIDRMMSALLYKIDIS